MPYTLKTQQISVKDPDSGEYIGVDVLTEQTKEGLIAELQAEGDTQIERINQAAVDVQSAVDQAETEAQQLISSTQSSLNTLETQKDTIAQTIASMAELGTDTTLTTAGMAADAKVTGDEISNVKNAISEIGQSVTNKLNKVNVSNAFEWGNYRQIAAKDSESPTGYYISLVNPFPTNSTFLCVASAAKGYPLSKGDTIKVTVLTGYSARFITYSTIPYDVHGFNGAAEYSEIVARNSDASYTYTCEADNIRMFVLLYRVDSQNISVSEASNVEIYYITQFDTLGRRIDDVEESIPGTVNELVVPVANNIVSKEVNINPFFDKWYNYRLLPGQDQVPAGEQTVVNNQFICSTKSAADANDFPNGMVLHLTINDGFSYMIIIFDAATRNIVKKYTDADYNLDQLISDADGLKIYILMYKRDASNISVSEASNVKGYVYDNDLKQRIFIAENKIKELEAQSVDVSTVFTGKTAVLLGDSLTEVNQHYTKGWYDWVREIIGLDSYTNYGISGSSIALNGGMCTRYANMVDADLVLVMGGTNDCLKSVPLGAATDTGIDTLYGAMKTLCVGLKNKYPTSIVVFITPHYQTKYPHSEGYTAFDISKIIKDVCYNYAIPVYDNCQLSGIYESNLTYFTVDKCHWNNTGHEMVGKNIAKWLLDTFRYMYR